MTTLEQRFEHKELIRRLVRLYNQGQDHHYTITRWPDEQERNARACDAFAEASGAQALAIEHTKVETFDSRKLDDARFVRIFGSLEAELKGALPYWVCLWIPTFALQPRTNWDAVKSSVRAWLQQNLRTLPEGRSKHKLPDVAFPITVEKRLDMPGNFFVGRFVPPDENDKKDLVDKFCTAMVDKDEQLRKYRDSGAETILLAESDDIALVSLQTLYRAFLLASDKTSAPNVGQVWMAHTYAPEQWCEIVCFLGPDRIMEKVNPANYRYGTRYRDEWLSAMRREQFAGLS